MTERTLAIDPSFLAAFTTLGGALLGLGRAEEALSLFDTVRHREPLAPTVMLHYRARALFMLGRFEEAEMSLKERIAKSPETDVSRALLASIYGHQGRLEEARAAWRELADVNPNYSVERRRAMLPSAEFELLASGLRKTGLVSP